MGKPSTEQLCRKYRNEDTHTEHVTDLALHLFDHACETLGMLPQDRPLLEVACRLHDIGYSTDWCEHHKAGAEIVLREEVRGFSSAQLAYIAAAILLHRKSFRPLLEHPIVRAPGDRRRVLRLAAILQVADGLDHGHLQDLRIAAVQCEAETVRVNLQCGWYDRNVTWARNKTDLWNEVFPVRLELTSPELPSDRPPFAGLLCKEDSTIDAARKVLYSQLRTILDNHDGVLAAEGPEPLHDVRVAIRRFRAALRLFRPVLPVTSVRELDLALSEVAKQTGPARDSDVWLRFLGRVADRKGFAKDTRFQELLSLSSNENRALQQQLAATLCSQAYSEAINKAVGFLKVEIPELRRRAVPHSACDLLARKLRGTFRRIEKRAHLYEDGRPEHMHQLRKRCRKERYWAEFATPVFGNAVEALAVRLKDVADVLGDIHDMDVYLERIESLERKLPKKFRKYLKKKRRKYVGKFPAAWDRLLDEDFKTDVLKELEAF